MEETCIEYLKSGLSVNTNSGCPLGCKYCILSSFLESDTIVKEICTPINLYQNMEKNKYFVSNKTPIFINNRTDPMISGVYENTVKFLKILEQNQITNCIIIISKLPPTEKISNYFSKLNLLYIYTYTNMRKGIDFNSGTNKLEYDLKAIKYYVPLESSFHSFRPIMKNINDSKEDITAFIEKTRGIFRKHIVSGVRVVSQNKKYIEALTNETFTLYNNKKKYLDDSFKKTIIQILEEEKSIIRHTSCAIASFSEVPTKLNRYFDKKEHCNTNCENFTICSRGVKFERNDINEKIKKITSANFIWENKNIVFTEIVEQEAISAIENAYGIHVFSEKIISSPSERILTNE